MRVLIFDPDSQRAEACARVVSEAGAQPHVCESERFAVSGTVAIVALADNCIPGAFGVRLVERLKQRGVDIIASAAGVRVWPLPQRCLLLLAGVRVLLDNQDRDFFQQLRHAIEQALREAEHKPSEQLTTEAVMQTAGIVGGSAGLLEAVALVIRFSAMSDPLVLITGETGTGKELFARTLHRLDPKRRRGPFVALNCSAISAGLAESELFGHRRGAFTGAERDRLGLIRSAEGGVLFLDEIGELKGSLQIKLLRVLEDHRVLAVGEEREANVNLRIVAASNLELKDAIQQNRFRADLFHRLNVLSIHLPPLRERLSDLRSLVEHFTNKFGAFGPARAPSVGEDFLEALAQLPWPGNVRQLENLIRLVLIHKASETPLSLCDLPAEIWHQLAAGQETQTTPKTAGIDSDAISFVRALAPRLAAQSLDLSPSLRECERQFIEAAIARAHGNQTEAARLLGITPRSVYNKLRRYRRKS